MLLDRVEGDFTFRAERHHNENRYQRRLNNTLGAQFEDITEREAPERLRADFEKMTEASDPQQKRMDREFAIGHIHT